MNWADCINRVIDYVEEDLTRRPDEAEIARIAACPCALFQAVFAQAAGMTLGEYVRRRRLTMAAYELENTDARVIDIAARYGYESPDAFRVAFRRMHGATPTQARRGGVPLKFCCRLRFEIRIAGVEQMEYTLEHREPFKVAGIRRTTPYGGGTWAVVKADGSNERMRALSGRFFDLGLCFGFGADGSNDYMCALEWEGEAEGFDTYSYPASDWITFCAQGRITENTLGGLWQRINEEFFPQSRYIKCGRKRLPTIEQYVEWDEARDYCHVRVMVPVDEKQEDE